MDIEPGFVLFGEDDSHLAALRVGQHDAILILEAVQLLKNDLARP